MQLKNNPVKLLGQNLTVKSAIECASRCSIAFAETSRYIITLLQLKSLKIKDNRCLKNSFLMPLKSSCESAVSNRSSLLAIFVARGMP